MQPASWNFVKPANPFAFAQGAELLSIPGGVGGRGICEGGHSRGRYPALVPTGAGAHVQHQHPSNLC